MQIRNALALSALTVSLGCSLGGCITFDDAP